MAHAAAAMGICNKAYFSVQTHMGGLKGSANTVTGQREKQ